jgi:hypothetical protein
MSFSQAKPEWKCSPLSGQLTAVLEARWMWELGRHPSPQGDLSVDAPKESLIISCRIAVCKSKIKES